MSGSGHARAARGAGFTLLEALVAMVLIMLVGMTLYSWLSTNLIGLGRVHATAERADAERSALEYLRTVNPMQDPSGSADIEGFGIRWDARPIAPTLAGAGYAGGTSRYIVGLYLVDVQVHSAAGQDFEFTVREAGYRQAPAAEQGG